jgi:hypothetical protein
MSYQTQYTAHGVVVSLELEDFILALVEICGAVSRASICCAARIFYIERNSFETENFY